MLDILSGGFRQARERLTGKATITDENIADAISDVRKSLLDADVEYGIAKEFISRVQEKSLGKVVNLRAGAGVAKVRVTAADHFTKICHDELVELMGQADASLAFASGRPTVFMMVGLQGSGKTTTTGKLCKYLMTKKKRKPLLVAADIYRPAAIDQLKVLGDRLGVPVFTLPGKMPVDIVREALTQAQPLGCDAILIDTAGRLTIDEALMDELKQIKAISSPDNILFVCDSMMGQDAVTTAKSFNDQVGMTGVVMTKLDGDARGGAALSIRRVTGRPIKFLGVGESLDRLEEFRPEGLASRILGMGDVVGLMEDFERVHEGDQEAEMLKMLEGQFNFKDFYQQLSMLQRMGSLKDIIAKLPMQNLIPKEAQIDDRELVKIKAMIDSMTEEERLKPSLFNDSRVRRIARGSGTKTNDVSEMIKRFKAMRQMMGSLGKGLGGMMGRLPGFGGGGAPDLSRLSQSMMGGLGGVGAGPSVGSSKKIDREKLKKMRKQAKDSRKKNRR